MTGENFLPYNMNIVNIILLSYLILGAMSMVSKEHPQIRVNLVVTKTRNDQLQ